MSTPAPAPMSGATAAQAAHAGLGACSSSDRRADYVSGWPQDDFIVPLVAGFIFDRIGRLAALAGPGATVLDLGCGREPFGTALESKGLAYTSCDVHQSPDRPVDMLCIVDGPLSPALAARGPFDLSVVTEVFEHVADWRSGFANMAALLKPGGKVLLTAPFFYPLHEEPYDFWRPTRHTIAAHAAGAGLEVEEFVGLGDAWHVMGTLLGATAFEPRRPGIAGRLWTLGCRVSRSVALRLIKSGVLPGSVAMPSKLYLSNGAVLRKPRGPEGSS